MDNLIQAAAAIVAELNDPGRAWHDQFTAQRGWAPETDYEKLSALTVRVVPIIETSTPANRGGVMAREYTIDVGFQRQAQNDVAILDDLVTIAGDVFAYFELLRPLTARPTAIVSATERVAIDQTELREGKFLAVVRLTVQETTA